EVRIALGDDTLTEVLVPAEDDDTRALGEIIGGLTPAVGARLPIPRGIDEWFEACGRVLRHGVLVAIDYVDDARGLLDRGAHTWVTSKRWRVAAAPPRPRR